VDQHGQRRHCFRTKWGVSLVGISQLLSRGGTDMKFRRPLFFAVVAAIAVLLANIAVSAVAAETHSKAPSPRLKRA
jgi:hypothetical protein